MPAILEQTGLVPTHIKMDIEGFEDEAIAGGLDCLRKYRPILFLELHGRFLRARGIDPAQVLRRLRDSGYARTLKDGADVPEQALRACDFECRIVCLQE